MLVYQSFIMSQILVKHTVVLATEDRAVEEHDEPQYRFEDSYPYSSLLLFLLCILHQVSTCTCQLR